MSPGRGLVCSRPETAVPPPPPPPAWSDTKKAVQVAIEGGAGGLPTKAELNAADVGAVRVVGASHGATKNFTLPGGAIDKELAGTAALAYLDAHETWLASLRADPDPIYAIYCIDYWPVGTTPLSLAEWGNRISNIVNRVNASYYEIGNEVGDSFGGGTLWSTWFDYAQVASDRVRAAGKRPILGGPMDVDGWPGPGSPAGSKTFFDRAQLRWGSSWAANWQGVAIHPYGQGGTTWSQTASLSSTRTRLSEVRNAGIPLSIPLFITEWGMGGHGNTGSTLVAGTNASTVALPSGQSLTGTTVSTSAAIPAAFTAPGRFFTGATTPSGGRVVSYTGFNGARTQFTGCTSSGTGTTTASGAQADRIVDPPGSTRENAQANLLTAGFLEIWKRRFDTSADVTAAGGTMPALNLRAITWFWWRYLVNPYQWWHYCGLLRDDGSQSPAYTAFAAEDRFRSLNPPAGGTVVRSDPMTNSDPWDLWGDTPPGDMADVSRHQLIPTGGPTGGPFRRIEVHDGDDLGFSGERAELGRNNNTFNSATQLASASNSSGTFWLGKSGKHEIIDYSVRLPTTFPSGGSAFQNITQWKHANPGSDASSDQPELTLQIRSNQFRLYGNLGSAVLLWSTPIIKGSWVPIEWDIVWSTSATTGRVQLTVGGDSSGMLPRITMAHYTATTANYNINDPMSSHMRMGIYRDETYTGTMNIDISPVTVRQL